MVDMNTIYDEFKLEIKKNVANLNYSNRNKDKVNRLFVQKLIDYKYNIDTISLIEGLIYVGMLPDIMIVLIDKKQCILLA